MLLSEHTELLKKQFEEIYKSMEPLLENLPSMIETNVHQTKLLVEKLSPVIANAQLSTSHLSEKFERMKPILERQLQNIKANYQDLTGEELSQINELNGKIENSYEIIQTKQPLSFDAKLNAIGLIITTLLALLALYQNHVYHSEDSKADAQFQSQVIQFLQEFCDNRCECVENHHATNENTQLPIQ